MAAAKVQAQWDGANWSDADLRSARVRHGAGTTNPDRPTLRPATGAAIAQQDPAPLEERLGARILLGATQIWDGTIYFAARDDGPGDLTRWRLSGKRAVDRQRRIEFARPPATAAETIADAAFWQSIGMAAPTTSGNLPERSLGRIEYRGTLGQWLSQLAAAAGAVICERSDGTVIFANPTASPAAGIETVSSFATRILTARTAERPELIRNSGTIEFPASTASATEPWSQTLSTTSLTIPAPTDDRGALSDWGYARSWTLSGFGGTHQFGVYGIPVLLEQSGTVAGPNADGNLTITLDALDPATITWQTNGYGTYAWNGQILNGQNNQIQVGSRALYYFASNQDMRTLTATLTTTQTTPARTYGAIDGQSIAAWGERPLVLPPWLIADPDTAESAIAAQVQGLAGLRREHTITIPLAQPTDAEALRIAAIDAGDYTRLILHDTDRHVDVDHACLVADRAIILAPGHAHPAVQLRCIETGAPIAADEITWDGDRLVWGAEPILWGA